MDNVLSIGEQDDHYRGIINHNIDFINRVCLKTVKLKSGRFLKTEFSIGNESDRLFNRVLDKLSEDNFRLLRKFEGRSKITTYIATIIARTAVDMIRERAGRDRGPDNPGVQRIPDLNGTTVRQGVPSGDGDYIIPDTGQGPEQIALSENSDRKMKEAVAALLSRLSGEERLLLRMKFPADTGTETKSTGEISKILGISRKGVYNRLDRLVRKCRRILSESGIKAGDFLAGEYQGSVRHIKRRVE